MLSRTAPDHGSPLGDDPPSRRRTSRGRSASPARSSRTPAARQPHEYAGSSPALERTGATPEERHAAGEAHADASGRHGLEQIDIEFDPAWLKLGELAGATAEFLRLALQSGEVKRPAWLDAVEARLDAPAPPSTTALARELGLNPAWLTQAYRAAMGEGIGETLRRKRVELATGLLRGTDAPAAEIAVTAGFCDQSHMIRAFRGLTGRTPSQVRAEWQALRRRPSVV